MSNDDPKRGPGSTDDPNQATRTPMPRPAPVKPDVTPGGDRDAPHEGPGSTRDPNQANRT